MKVLFYTELHPIRNELIHHNSVVVRWMNIISRLNDESVDAAEDEYSYKILCHHYHYKQALMASNNAGEYLLPVLPEEFEHIKSNLKYWNSESIRVWADMLEGKEFPQNQIYKDILLRVRKIFNYDVVVFWGDNDYLADWLRSLGIRVVYMELACMRNPFPSSVYMDIKGVNGKCSSALLGYKYIKESSKLLPSPEVLIDLANQQPMSNGNPFDVANSVISLDGWLSDLIKFDAKKKILIPLQIADDTNILTSSPFVSAAEFLRKVINDFTGQDVELFVKPHPGAISRAGVVYQDHAECRKLVESCSCAHWFDADIPREDYLQFLKTFDGIVTINSSLGFEAMMLGVPTVALGQAMYKPFGVAYDSSNYVNILLNSSDTLIEEGENISKFIFSTKLFPIEKGIAIKEKFESHLSIAIDEVNGDINGYYKRLINSPAFPFWSESVVMEETC